MLAQVPDNIGGIVHSPGVGSAEPRGHNLPLLAVGYGRHGIYCVEAVQEAAGSLIPEP